MRRGGKWLFTALKQSGHREPVRRLVWQSPKVFGQFSMVFPSVEGDSHASVRTGSE